MTRQLTKLLPASLLLIFSVFSTATAATAEMKVFEGFASSNALLRGDIATAVKIADRRKGSALKFSRFVNETTLCVALTKLGQLDLALDSCTRAELESKRISNIHLESFGFADLSKIEVSQIARANLAITQRLIAQNVTERVASTTP